MNVGLSACAMVVLFLGFSPLTMHLRQFLTFSSGFSVAKFLLRSLNCLDLCFMQCDGYGFIYLHSSSFNLSKFFMKSFCVIKFCISKRAQG